MPILYPLSELIYKMKGN